EVDSNGKSLIRKELARRIGKRRIDDAIWKLLVKKGIVTDHLIDGEDREDSWNDAESWTKDLESAFSTIQSRIANGSRSKPEKEVIGENTESASKGPPFVISLSASEFSRYEVERSKAFASYVAKKLLALPAVQRFHSTHLGRQPLDSEKSAVIIEF